MKKNIPLKTIVSYVALAVLTVITLQYAWFYDTLDNVSLLNWDAEHYQFIKDSGYLGFRIAFFPLFPLMWKLLSVGELGIVLFNALLFLVAFYFLIKTLQIKKTEEILLYLSIPSFIFFFLPYSESIFFLCSTLILIGLKKQKNNLVYIGLFFAILSRPAFTIFIPALIITELFNPTREKKFLRIGAYALISLVGIALIGVIQFADTGEWFKFFSEQKEWGNQLQIPTLPLTSWAGGLIVKTDGFAFLIGILAGGFVSALLLRIKWVKELKPSKEVIFSLAYLGGITLSVLLFRGGSLFSLNRFVFATPFIIVGLNYWMTQKVSLSLKNLLVLFGLIFCFWLLFGSYVHIQLMLKFALLTLYVLLIFAMKSDKAVLRKYSIWLLILTNFTFQIMFYFRFLNGEWVG